MLNRSPTDLALARLTSTPAGLTGHVEIADKVDKRMLLMLADNLLEALEQSGYIENIVTSSPQNEP